MRRFYRYFAIFVAILIVGSGCQAGIPGRFLKPKPPLAYEPPTPESWTLSNGIQVKFLENNELPVVSGAIYFPGGAMWEEQISLGTTNALSRIWRDGGTLKYSPDVLDSKLESLAATISTNFGGEFGGASFNCLKPDLATVEELFREVVLRPRFDQKRLDLWKIQAIDEISRRPDDPETVASITAAALLFRGLRPGMALVSSNVKAITVAKLRDLYLQLVHPDGAVLTLTGALNKSEAQELSERLFANWSVPVAAKPLPPLLPIESEKNSGVYFVEGPYTQASIVIAQRGVRRFSPDQSAIEIFNEALGTAGFSSRLFKTVRTELGLAYSVMGGIFPGRRSGQNIITIQTKGESAGTAIQASIRVLRALQQDGVTQSELSDAKRAIANGFVFQFDSPASVLGREVSQHFTGFPEDFDATYLENIKAVTSDEVKEVAKTRWDISNLLVVVAGDKTAYNSLASGIKDIPELNVPVQTLKFKETVELN